MEDLRITLAIEKIAAFEADLRRVEKAVDKSLGKVEDSTEKGRKGFKALAAEVPILGQAINLLTNPIVLVGAAITGAVAGITKFVNSAANFEQTKATFESLTGSMVIARNTLADLDRLAETTPFELDQVQEGGKRLLAFGFEATKVADNLSQIGDIAAGLNIPLNDLVTVYGQTRVQGRLFARDLLQFTSRGIPLADELAKQFGVTTAEVNELVSAGKVGFPEVEQAFASLTSEGGKFFGLMERQSQTFGGIISNIQDILARFARDAGERILPIAKGLAQGVLDALTALQSGADLGDVFGPVGRAIESILDAVDVLKRAFASIVEPIREAVSGLQASLGDLGRSVRDVFVVAFGEGSDAGRVLAGVLAEVTRIIVVGFVQNLQIAANIIRVVVDLIGDFIQFLTDLDNAVRKTFASWKTLTDRILPGVSVALDGVLTIGRKVKEFFLGLTEDTTPAVVKAGQAGAAIGLRLMQQAQKQVEDYQASLVTTVEKTGETVAKKFIEVFDFVSNVQIPQVQISQAVTGELVEFIPVESLQRATGFIDVFAENINEKLGKISPVFSNFKEEIKSLVQDGIEPLLGNQAVNVLENFGQSLGKAIATGRGFADAFIGIFRDVLQTILVEVPKLIGVGLIRMSIFGLPATLPLFLTGLGLVGLSGLAGGLLGGLFGGRNNDSVSLTPQIQTNPGQQILQPVGVGLGAFGGQGGLGQQQPVNNIYIESDGILSVLQARTLRNDELINGR